MRFLTKNSYSLAKGFVFFYEYTRLVPNPNKLTDIFKYPFEQVLLVFFGLTKLTYTSKFALFYNKDKIKIEPMNCCISSLNFDFVSLQFH